MFEAAYSTSKSSTGWPTTTSRALARVMATLKRLELRLRARRHMNCDERDKRQIQHAYQQTGCSQNSAATIACR